ncbi:MAG: hypothetical protein HYR86_02150, partial [Candidatus Rokubacteria bacterium]|nr:hypothetical protein [Candidatus Rokubacteria bacterium]
MRPRTARWLAIALGVTLLGGTGSSLAQSRDVTEPPPVARAEDGTEMVRVPAG